MGGNCTNCRVEACIIARFCTKARQQKINTSKIVVPYKKHQPIVKEETTAMGIYIIYSGKVLIVSEKEHLKKQIIRLAIPGDIIEHKEEENKLTSPFTAEAFADCVICYIPKVVYFRLLKEDPQITGHLEQFYTNKFIKAESRLKNYMMMNNKAKLADALLMVADAFEGEVPFSRKELAELSGISADQVSRELKKLADEGAIIKKNKNRISIIEFSILLSRVREYDDSYSLSPGQKSVKKQKPG